MRTDVKYTATRAGTLSVSGSVDDVTLAAGLIHAGAPCGNYVIRSVTPYAVVPTAVSFALAAQLLCACHASDTASPQYDTPEWDILTSLTGTVAHNSPRYPRLRMLIASTNNPGAPTLHPLTGTAPAPTPAETFLTRLQSRNVSERARMLVKLLSEQDITAAVIEHDGIVVALTGTSLALMPKLHRVAGVLRESGLHVQVALTAPDRA
jgi:hypothetical protein